MKKEDIDSIEMLEQQCFTSDAWTKADFESVMSSPFDTGWVYRDEEIASMAGKDIHATAGYCILRILGEEAEILNVCLAEWARGRHSGDLLMDVMLQKCMEQGVRAVYLEVRQGNRPALALYEKHGFVSCGIRKNYYQNPVEDAVLMKKTDYDYEMFGRCACGKEKKTENA